MGGLRRLGLTRLVPYVWQTHGAYPKARSTRRLMDASAHEARCKSELMDSASSATSRRFAGVGERRGEERNR